jgi:putative tryptophan/tyrosine transport system substrate-binding protein
MRVSRRQLVQGAGALGLGLLAGCGRLPWQAAQSARLPRVGWITTNNSLYDVAFRDGLLEHGYVDSQNLLIESRRADTQEESATIAAELVHLQPDAIVAVGGLSELQKATRTIPIIMALSIDPVEQGYVASLARPGGNITGLSALMTQLHAKRLQLLTEVVPRISRVGVVWNPPTVTPSTWDELTSAATTLGLALHSVEVRGPDELDALLPVLPREHLEGLILTGGPFESAYFARFAEFIVRSHLPAISAFRPIVAGGSLMAYGPNLGALVRRSGYYVDRILKGTRPADLPVEQPREFDFVINLRTAQALGLTIPPHILLQATEVIQ